MKNEEKTKAEPHDQNNELPKDVLNLEQDPNSFKDPLAQQSDKQTTDGSREKAENSKKGSEE